MKVRNNASESRTSEAFEEFQNSHMQQNIGSNEVHSKFWFSITAWWHVAQTRTFEFILIKFGFL